MWSRITQLKLNKKQKRKGTKFIQPADFARKYLQITVHRFLSTIFYLQYFNCYILRCNKSNAIYNLLYLHFFKPLLEGSLLPQEDTTQEIRL